MAKVGWESVILNNDWIQDLLKQLKGFLVSSIDSSVLVIKLNSTGNGLQKKDKRCHKGDLEVLSVLSLNCLWDFGRSGMIVQIYIPLIG